MKQLWLLRHAKSSWDDPSLPDRLRPLSGRGRRATEVLTRHLSANGVTPELVLCSSARRTRETLDGVRDGLPAEALIEIDEDLYGADADEILARLHQVPGRVASVMVIGHNPGLEDLAHGLTGSGRPDLRARLATKFPTGALAGFEVPNQWTELDWGVAALTDFVVPRDLT